MIITIVKIAKTKKCKRCRALILPKYEYCFSCLMFMKTTKPGKFDTKRKYKKAASKKKYVPTDNLKPTHKRHNKYTNHY